jgi:hypothetical protein
VYGLQHFGPALDGRLGEMLAFAQLAQGLGLLKFLFVLFECPVDGFHFSYVNNEHIKFCVWTAKVQQAYSFSKRGVGESLLNSQESAIHKKKERDPLGMRAPKFFL